MKQKCGKLINKRLCRSRTSKNCKIALEIRVTVTQRAYRLKCGRRPASNPQEIKQYGSWLQNLGKMRLSQTLYVPKRAM